MSNLPAAVVIVFNRTGIWRIFPLKGTKTSNSGSQGKHMLLVVKKISFSEIYEVSPECTVPQHKNLIFMVCGILSKTVLCIYDPFSLGKSINVHFIILKAKYK